MHRQLVSLVAESDALLLHRPMACVNKGKLRTVFLWDDGAAAEGCSVFIREERNRQMCPVHQICGHGMTPVHRPPGRCIRVVLIE